MPRLSLYKPERGQDYKFIDRQISEMFQVGGTDVYLHKYIGPMDPTDPTQTLGVTGIQDVVFLENRDRKYDQEIYRIRGLYNVQNIDFNLSAFGLFIDQDTLFMTVHINDFIKYVGRKPISGDVIELPHLRDTFALNDSDISLPRYYVIEDVGRASEGFSSTWYPHLYRLKIKKITNSQQFADILNKPALDSNGDPAPNGQTLNDLLSTYNKEIAINNAVLSEAEANAPQSGYETRQFYTLGVDDTGKTTLKTVDAVDPLLDASNVGYNASATEGKALKTGYTGYLVGDGIPQNGYAFGHGIQFPDGAAEDDFFLRTDFLPNRLFRFDGARWVKVEDAVRMTMTNNDDRQTYKTGFINNSEYIYNDIIDTDIVRCTAGQFVIDTNIDYKTSTYIFFKLETTTAGYEVNGSVITNHLGKVRITLPIIKNEQQVIPYDGLWNLQLCNNREAVKQSLSKALKYKPEADF